MTAELKQEVHSKILGALLAAAALIFFLPYLINYRYIVAAAVQDDSLFGYRAVANNIEYFENDIVRYVLGGHVLSTPMNYVSLWLDRATPIPLDIIYNVLVFVQLFGVPLILVFVLKRYLNTLELVFTFMLVLLSGYEHWNFANYGHVEVPYAAGIAMPFLWIGLYFIAHHRKSGYALLSAGALIHPLLGLHSVFIAFVVLALDLKPLRLQRFLLLAVPFLCALVHPLLVMSEDFPRVSKEDMLRVLDLNMHATPWDAVFRWPHTFPTMASLGLFALLTHRRWARLGPAYPRLLKGALVAVSILSLSQIAGHMLKSPNLILLAGLRAPVFASILLIPVLVLFLKDLFESPCFPLRFWACFITLLVAFGRPYGIDKMPILIVSAYLLLAGGKSLGRLQAARLMAVLHTIMWCWLAVWLFYRHPKPQIFSNENIGAAWSFLDYLKTNWLVDFGPVVTQKTKALIACASFLAAVWPLVRSKVRTSASPIDVRGTICATAFVLFLAFCFASYENHTAFGNQRRRDLYHAQVWARENTLPGTLFIVDEGTWRSFSERPSVSPLPQLYYYYFPHAKVKSLDDKIIRILGLEERFKKYNQKQWYLAKRVSYKARFKEPIDFKMLGTALGARYLVEGEDMNLPVVYSNTTYKIYDLS